MDRVNFNKRKTVHGIAINDADYEVYQRIEGGILTCPIYSMWYSMVTRCLSGSGRARIIRPNVSDEWLKFSNFNIWFLKSYKIYSDMTLDKDILGDGNLYSPENCTVIPNKVNLIVRSYNTFKKSELPLGVYFNKRLSSYVARCTHEGNSGKFYYFDTPEEAHYKYLGLKSDSIKLSVDSWKMEETYIDSVGDKLLGLSGILHKCSQSEIEIKELVDVLHSSSFRALWK